MEEILNESEIKLDGVRQKILQVAQEVSGEDMHQFHRAITTGLQEYVEAVSFQHFIKIGSLISMDEINKQLIFTTEDNGKENKTELRLLWTLRCLSPLVPLSYRHNFHFLLFSTCIQVLFPILIFFLFISWALFCKPNLLTFPRPSILILNILQMNRHH
uniref:Translin associated factor X n=1 Tax=Microcebus murinus TaxID=30608 RepID=A0A8C5VZX6_MICMU